MEAAIVDAAMDRKRVGDRQVSVELVEGETSIFPNARQDDFGQPFDGVDGVGNPERPFSGPQPRSAKCA